MMNPMIIVLGGMEEKGWQCWHVLPWIVLVDSVSCQVENCFFNSILEWNGCWFFPCVVMQYLQCSTNFVCFCRTCHFEIAECVLWCPEVDIVAFCQRSNSIFLFASVGYARAAFATKSSDAFFYSTIFEFRLLKILFLYKNIFLHLIVTTFV